ncbi:MAG: response regulator [bacterium]|nr:response regulator [bacterium]
MARILIMEDEVLVAQALQDTLESAGHQVWIATNGEEGSQLASANQVDLAVVDIFMPRQDGIAAIMELKKASPDTKVIAISGGGAVVRDFDYLEYARALGAVECFHKPIDPQELLDTIEAVL